MPLSSLHIPSGQQVFSIEEACMITNEIISAEFGEGVAADVCVDLNEWKALVIPDGAVASVNCEQKRIQFPRRRSRGAYTREERKSIIIHELGVHALRFLPYESREIKAFFQGLPGYESFEEGVAKAVDQAVSHQYEDFGLLHYVSIGLASLLGKNFREVYEIQCRIEHLTGENRQGGALTRFSVPSGEPVNCPITRILHIIMGKLRCGNISKDIYMTRN